MARILCNGNTKVTWVTSVAVLGVMTAAEGNGGTDLQDLITPDGINLSITDSEVDASVLSSDSEYSFPGTFKVACSLTLQRDSVTGTDKGWTTFVRNTAGFLVIRRNTLASVTWAIADKYEIYTMTVGKRSNNPPAKNTLQTMMVALFNSGPSTDTGLIAA